MKSISVFLTIVVSVACWCDGAYSANKQKTNNSQVVVESYADIIGKAQNLSLQKDRTQALALLLAALKKEGKHTSKAFKDLTKAMDKISQFFYSDRTQQLYELGISLRNSDPNMANQKLTEAGKMEPDNMLIQLALIRQQISLNECANALNIGKKLKEQLPFSEEVDLVQAQAAVCSGQIEAFQQLKTQNLDSKSTLFRHWVSLDAEACYKTSMFQKGIDLAEGLQNIEPQFPEIFYWKWKTLLELKRPAEESANKYLNLCKSISIRAQRDYIAEPQLCRRTHEVEAFLKKNNSTGVH